MIGTQFNPAECGSITGQVLWDGPVPQVPRYNAPFTPRPESGIIFGRKTWDNPRSPVVSREGGLASAVVFLKEVNLPQSRPWDHSPVTVAVRQHQLQVHQDSLESRFGFVQRGQTIDLINHDKCFHSIQARGAAFFNLPFADPDKPHPRRLTQKGIVELTSGCGAFWMAGFLFVDNHPYYARTGSDGRFVLPQVPAGTYQLVCWHPDWREISRELDGDTWEVASIEFRPALTIEVTVQVEADKAT